MIIYYRRVKRFGSKNLGRRKKILLNNMAEPFPRIKNLLVKKKKRAFIY